MLGHECDMCEEKPKFRNFLQLKKHMNMDHKHFYCDLCVDNLKVKLKLDTNNGFWIFNLVITSSREDSPSNSIDHLENPRAPKNPLVTRPLSVYGNKLRLFTCQGFLPNITISVTCHHIEAVGTGFNVSSMAWCCSE